MQFLWELHFIEAGASAAGMTSPAGCSSFGNCTSLRQPDRRGNEGQQDRLQFLWELHFIEALLTSPRRGDPWLQFLWELHFIEASRPVCVPRGRWLQFLWELHFIEAQSRTGHLISRRLQFLWELHFIEARPGWLGTLRRRRCSSFGNCTSLRQDRHVYVVVVAARALQFLWELHFIEALPTSPGRTLYAGLQFLWELHFIEAAVTHMSDKSCHSCSSFGNCTSLRHDRQAPDPAQDRVAVPLGTALH